MLEEKHDQTLKNPEINNLKLFWIAMGGEHDIDYQNGKNTLALLDKYGIKYQTNDFPAGHTLLTWSKIYTILLHCFSSNEESHFEEQGP